jgi:FAD/FMN-containing dehydrogenase
MARFKDIVLNEEEGTVEIGAGLTWTEVYAYLVPKCLTVVGGRINDVGVSGFTLGGGRHTLLCRACIVFAQRDAHVVGYSWKTNQYGLTIDTVTAFELVLPNGYVKKVTEEDEDLWFALRVRAKQCLCRNSSLTVTSKGRIEQLRELVERASRGKTTFDNLV